jgi:hypothetical protein
MDAPQLVVGTLIICGAVYLAATQREFASSLHRHYNRPETDWRPRWLFRRLFRPTERQSSAMAWIFVGVALAVGMTFFVTAWL